MSALHTLHPHSCDQLSHTKCHSQLLLLAPLTLGLVRCAAVQLYVLEEEATSLARQLLLLTAFSDADLSQRERMEAFLDLHHNALLHETTHNRLVTHCRRLTQQLVAHEPVTISPSNCRPYTLDPSELKHKSLDAVLQHLAFISSTTAAFDLPALRDARLRHYYGARYDHRSSVLDWDYHYRLRAVASILHIVHYRRWRLSGQLYEKRNCTYAMPNRSLASYREGRQKGRGQVQVRGFWSDVVVSPAIVYGLQSDRDELYELRQGQHMHTSVDVAEDAVTALMTAAQEIEGHEAVGPRVSFHLLHGPLSALSSRARFHGRFHRIFLSQSLYTSLPQVAAVAAPSALLSMDTMHYWPIKEEEKAAAFHKLQDEAQSHGWQPIQPPQPALDALDGGTQPRSTRAGSDSTDRTAHGSKCLHFTHRLS